MLPPEQRASGSRDVGRRGGSGRTSKDERLPCPDRPERGFADRVAAHLGVQDREAALGPFRHGDEVALVDPRDERRRHLPAPLPLDSRQSEIKTERRGGTDEAARPSSLRASAGQRFQGIGRGRAHAQGLQHVRQCCRAAVVHSRLQDHPFASFVGPSKDHHLRPRRRAAQTHRVGCQEPRGGRRQGRREEYRQSRGPTGASPRGEKAPGRTRSAPTRRTHLEGLGRGWKWAFDPRDPSLKPPDGRFHVSLGLNFFRWRALRFSAGEPSASRTG